MMSKLLKTSCAAMGLLFAALFDTAAGQENLPFGPSNYEQDLQLFAPFQTDLDGGSQDQWSGYHFEYNKLFWWYGGEKTTIGSTNVTDSMQWFNGVNSVQISGDGQFAEVIYRVNPQDDMPYSGTPVPAPPLINNTITDAPPKAGLGMGNRYEFGYRDQGHGWQIGILDGPEVNQTSFYGMVPDPALGNGLPPFIDDDYTNNTDIGPGGGDTADPGGRAFGFGSVPVMFEYPEGYMTGFRDYLNYLADAAIGTQVGPYMYIGNYGYTQELGDQDDDPTIPVFRLADDLDGDGIFASDIILVVGPDGTIRLGVMRDWDDLHKFNIYFDNVTIHTRTETDGIEAMWSHDLTNSHYMAKHQNNRLSVSWGARFLKVYDQFDFNATGSVLHGAEWTTVFNNQIVGPQVGFQWINQRQRWRLSTEGRFTFGYNIADWDQKGLIGAGLVPGGLNQPLYARPTAFSNGLTEREFSPLGELRVQASYHIFEKAALKFGYTGSYVGNIRRAAPSVRYTLPAVSYNDTGGEDFITNGFDLGVEFVY